jgi:hypothetical protein
LINVGNSQLIELILEPQGSDWDWDWDWLMEESGFLRGNGHSEDPLA